jgi:hypothetical protein
MCAATFSSERALTGIRGRRSAIHPTTTPRPFASAQLSARKSRPPSWPHMRTSASRFCGKASVRAALRKPISAPYQRCAPVQVSRSAVRRTRALPSSSPRSRYQCSTRTGASGIT